MGIVPPLPVVIVSLLHSRRKPRPNKNSCNLVKVMIKHDYPAIVPLYYAQGLPSRAGGTTRVHPPINHGTVWVAPLASPGFPFGRRALVSFARPGHSRESGNPLRKPLGMCCRRTGFLPPWRDGNNQRLEWIPIPNDTSTGRRGFLTLLLGEYKFLRYARGGKATGDSRGRVVAPLLLCPARPLRTTTLVARPDASGSHSGGHPHPEHHVAQRHSGFAQSSQIRPAKLAGITARLLFRSGGVCATRGLLQAESSNHPRFC